MGWPGIQGAVSQPTYFGRNGPAIHYGLYPLKAGLISRLQTQGWTSHRTYLGRDPTPEWLSTFYFESVFDDPSELHDYVLGLHRGKVSWPDRMALDTGWLKMKQTGGPSKVKPTRSDKAKFINIETAFAGIAKVAGVPKKRLLQIEYGPRSNPSRRFAVWALKDCTQLTHREIGKALSMSESQVAHILRRLRNSDIEEPLFSWMAQWQEYRCS